MAKGIAGKKVLAPDAAPRIRWQEVREELPRVLGGRFMLRILGWPSTLCDGLTRRDFLQVGGLGALGLGLADALRLSANTTAPSHERHFGRAKSCILLFLYGSPSQIETF